jgi:hypothetical protein
MSATVFHLIDRSPDDPTGQLLAAVLDVGPARVGPFGPDHVPRSDEEVWFLSQRGFLESAARMGTWACKVNVILRRAGSEDEAKAVQTELSIVQSVAASLPDSVDLSFYALSETAAEYIMDLGISDCEALGEPDPTDAPLPLAEIMAGQDYFNLMHSDIPVRLDQDAVNWARLARRFRFVARFDNASDMLDLVDLASRLPEPRRPERPEYLFITPNGVGLGHLTRQLAVARALVAGAPSAARPIITFWCFSRAAAIIRQAGYRVILRHTSEYLGSEGVPWLAWETEAFGHYLRHHRPAAIITDGSRVEPFIVNAMKQPGNHHARLVWIRRGMWRADADDRGLGDVRFCDHILIPGDLAAPADPGATARENPNPPGLSRETVTPPVILHDPVDRLDRKTARKALDLGRGIYCLVSLGGDSFARTAIVHDKLVEAARDAKVQLIWAQSPLAAIPRFSRVEDQRLRLYPINPYLQAFDGVVSATGYNSFHELLLLCDAPVLFVPTTNARLDDQAARARYAAEQGWAEVLDHEQGDDEDAVFARFFASLRQNIQVKRPRLARDGSDEMAQIIAGLVQSEGLTS